MYHIWIVWDTNRYLLLHQIFAPWFLHSKHCLVESRKWLACKVLRPRLRIKLQFSVEMHIWSEKSQSKPRSWFQICLFGELIHFGYLILFKWVETTNLATAHLPKKGNDSLTPFSTCNQPLLNKKIDSIRKVKRTSSFDTIPPWKQTWQWIVHHEWRCISKIRGLSGQSFVSFREVYFKFGIASVSVIPLAFRKTCPPQVV